MQYKIESIGGEFTDKSIEVLADRFTSHDASGYKLHSVFQAQRASGCFGSQKEITYYAIYIKE